MRSPATISRFVDDHARIRKIVAALERFLQLERAPDEAAFARRRWELIREVSVHLAVEGRIITDMAKGIRLAPHLLQQDATLAAEVRTHMAEWTAAAIEERWPTYRRTTRALLARLRRRMEYEETSLFPALADPPGG